MLFTRDTSKIIKVCVSCKLKFVLMLFDGNVMCSRFPTNWRPFCKGWNGWGILKVSFRI